MAERELRPDPGKPPGYSLGGFPPPDWYPALDEARAAAAQSAPRSTNGPETDGLPPAGPELAGLSPSRPVHSVVTPPGGPTPRTWPGLAPLAETYQSPASAPPRQHSRELHSEMNLLARAGSLGLVGQFASSLLAFGFSLAVGHLFKARGSGVFFSALALFSIACAVGEAGADWGLNRTLPKLRAEGRVRDVRRLLPLALVPVFVFSCLLGIALYVAAPELAPLVSHGRSTAEIVTFVRILALFVPIFALIPVLVAGTRGFDSVLPLVAISNIGVPAARLLLLPVFLGAGFGLVSAAYAWALPLILGAVGILWCLLALAERYRRERTVDLSRPATPKRDLAKEFWSFTAPRSLAAAFSVIVLWLDVLLVGGLVSTRQAGIYAVASRYMTIAGYASGAIGGTIGPQTARLITAGRLVDLRHLYQVGSAWVLALAWPISLGTIVFSPLLMRFFGPGFVTGATALSILSLGMLASTATGNNGTVLAMTGGSGMSLLIAGVSMAVNIGLNLALIPHFGIDGSATAWAVTLLVNNAIGAIVIWRRFRLQPASESYLEVALASLVCIGLFGALCRLALGATVTSFLLAMLIGGGAYIGFLWWRRRALGFDVFANRMVAA